MDYLYGVRYAWDVISQIYLLLRIMLTLTLHWRIPSKKNQKQRTGRFLVSSKQYQKREKEQLIALNEQVEELKINSELYMEYHFYMPDNRKCDLSNKVESINDLFVKYGLIEDDNWNILRYLMIRCEWVDKEDPRCEIKIYFMNVNE